MGRPLSEFEKVKLKLDSVNLAVSTVAMGAAVAALCMNEKGEEMSEEKEYKTRRDLKRDARREIKRKAVTQIGYPGPVLVLNEGNRTGPVWHPYVVPHDDDTRRSLKRRYAREVKAMAVNEVGYTGPVLLLDKKAEPEPWLVERRDGRKAKIYMSPAGGDDVWTAFGRSYPEAWDAAPDQTYFAPWHGERFDERFTQDEDEALAAWLRARVRSYAKKPAKKKAKGQTRWVAMQMTRNGGDAQAVVCKDRAEAESRARAMKRSRDPSARGRYVQGYARMDTSKIDVAAWAGGKRGPFYEV